MRNPDPVRDGLNLPEFELVPPTTKLNWEINLGAGDAKIDSMLAQVRHLQAHEKLVASDLVAGFIARRVQPLQKRSHRTCDMSFRKDPTRTSTSDLTPQQVVQRVNAIVDFKLPDDWWFGMEPYCHNLSAPKVRHRARTCLFVCLLSFFSCGSRTRLAEIYLATDPRRAQSRASPPRPLALGLGGQ